MYGCVRGACFSAGVPMYRFLRNSAKGAIMLLMGMLCVGASFSAGALSAEDILQGMAEADKKYDELSMQMETTSEWSNGERYIDEQLIRKDGATGRFEEKLLNRHCTQDDPDNLVLDMERHMLWTGEMAYSLGAHVKSITQPLIVSKKPDGGFVTDYSCGSGGELFRGMLYIPRPVWEICREHGNTELQETREEVDGSPCYVIKSSGKHGEITVWVDAEHEFVIRKALVEKGPDCVVLADKRLKDYDDPGLKMVISLDNVRVELIDGHYVPMVGTRSLVDTNADGSTTTFTENVEIKSINFHPDFLSEGAFVLNVPEGTEVWHQDAPVKGVWKNGAEVAVLSEEEMETIKEEIGQPSEPVDIAEGEAFEAGEPAQAAVPETEKRRFRFNGILAVVCAVGLCVVGGAAIVWRKRRRS